LAYPSVDKIQNMLAQEVFGYAADKKKASGRALGTLVELITFYTLCAWNLRDSIAIERPIPEFANPDISHNVEFSLHPIAAAHPITLNLPLPITSRKVLKAAKITPEGLKEKNQSLVTANRVMRNSAVVAEHNSGFLTTHLVAMNENQCTIALTDLLNEPYAIFECKRVGVEEGMRKGPQTIEKAKQGAYVARSVSALQKFRLRNGEIQGVLDTGNGQLITGDYALLLQNIIAGTNASHLRNFILTVGVVSNHGNWFTAENHNKELKVLAHSYDWLLFLTDGGLCQFIEKLLLKPVPELEPARDAFLASYQGKPGSNCFTKVKIRVEADLALKSYFKSHESEIESWFNVITPQDGSLTYLRNDLVKLLRKDWRRIRHP